MFPVTWEISINTLKAFSYQVLKDSFYSWYKPLVYQLQWPGNPLDLNIWDEQNGPSLGIPRRQNQDRELPKLTNVEWNQFQNLILPCSWNVLKIWTHLRFVHLVSMFQTLPSASLCVSVKYDDDSSKIFYKGPVEIFKMLTLSGAAEMQNGSWCAMCILRLHWVSLECKFLDSHFSWKTDKLAYVSAIA